jgi:RNase P/RNase MRP subunit p30
MRNFIRAKPSKELLDLSKQLGFSETLFLEQDFTYINEKNFKEILKQIQKAKRQGLISVVKPHTEPDFRQILEKSNADIIVGVEDIHPKDSLHYVRGGLDQIMCNIAHNKNKIIAVSMSDLFNAKNKSFKLARIKANLKLCKKYKVELLFTSFATTKEDMRQMKDIKSFITMLKKKN